MHNHYVFLTLALLFVQWLIHPLGIQPYAWNRIKDRVNAQTVKWGGCRFSKLFHHPNTIKHKIRFTGTHLTFYMGEYSWRWHTKIFTQRFMFSGRSVRRSASDSFLASLSHISGHFHVSTHCPRAACLSLVSHNLRRRAKHRPIHFVYALHCLWVALIIMHPSRTDPRSFQHFNSDEY